MSACGTSTKKALKAAVRKKVAGKDIVVPQSGPEPAAAADLIEALRRSVKAVKSGKDPVGDISHLRSNFTAGIKHMAVRFTQVRQLALAQ